MTPYVIIQEIGSSFYVYVGPMRVGIFKTFEEAAKRKKEIEELIDHE